MDETYGKDEEAIDKYMDDTAIEIPKSKKRYRTGLTYLQECFARMCAHYPADELTTASAASQYKKIPGIVVKKDVDFRTRAYALLKDPNVARQIELYRQVLGKDELSLKLDREAFTNSLLDAWHEAPPVVKTEHVLQALKDREQSLDIKKKKDDDEDEDLFKSARVKEGLDEINVTPKNKKDV